MLTEKIRVLIVDDERHLRELYRAELAPTEFTVMTLDRGDVVLEHLHIGISFRAPTAILPPRSPIGGAELYDPVAEVRICHK